MGAFAAGLVLEDAHYQGFDRAEHSLGELIEPVAVALAPIFFVLKGMRTDLRLFAQPGVPLLALALTGAAILGKYSSPLSASSARRWTASRSVSARCRAGKSA